MAARRRLIAPGPRMAARAGLIALALASTLACVQDDGTRFNPLRDLTTVSEDDERGS